MDLNLLLNQLKNCPCGRDHTVNIKSVQIGHGVKDRTAEILDSCDFPKKILLVADNNTLNASDGIIDILRAGGYECELKLYDNFRCPTVANVDEIIELSKNCEGILSVGTGSLNDICRRAAFLAYKRFAIFATAPSMDGFAAATAPIIENNIKSTLDAKQPEVIMADTKILAASPTELKRAGFGDIIGKYIALTDWRVSTLLTGEYFCNNIANLVREALSRISKLANRVADQDEETAGAIMETLVLTGIAMKLAESSRPASGAEHMISHFWGMKKLEDGILGDYHGKKVGVATYLLVGVYHKMIDYSDIIFQEDTPNWDGIFKAYGPKFHDYIVSMSTPSATVDFDKKILSEKWREIKNIVKDELPTEAELCEVMSKAGAAVNIADIGIEPELAVMGILYHPYMRHKITLSRLDAMTNLDLSKLLKI